MSMFMRAEATRHEMQLLQLGAKVDQINSMLCYVSFDVAGTKVSYVYNVNRKDKYFLERVTPYPMHAGVYDTEEDVVKTISVDIEQFRMANVSHVFDLFVQINQDLHHVAQRFEDLFLYYNVPHPYLDAIMAKSAEMQSLIDEAKAKSERVYTKKDPERL